MTARRRFSAVPVTVSVDLVAVDDHNDEVETLEARCQAAIDVVQRDLDRTGLSEHQMHARNLQSGGVEMFAALPNGDSYSGGGVGGMTEDMDDATLLWHAAASVSDTLAEVVGKTWPGCAQHGGWAMTPPNLEEVSDGLVDGRVWWWCRADGGHAVAPVGELQHPLNAA